MSGAPNSVSNTATGSPRRTRWWRRGAGALAAAAALLFASTSAAGAAPGAAPRAGDPSASLRSFEQGKVAVEGGELNYMRGGSGPPLVLLHGWPESWSAWQKVMPDLARSNTVIAFDLPGLGSSDVPPNGFDAATTARRIHEGVGKLGLGQVRILAHDLGALVAYPYARDFPADVSRMAVLETPLNGFGLEDAYGVSWHFGFNSAPKPVPEKLIGDRDDVRTYLGWLFSSARYPDRIDQEKAFSAYASPARRSAGYEYYRAFAANAADNKANAGRRLSMPVLAMGAQDVFGPAVAQSFRQVADDVREVVAPDTGHWIPEENPAFLTECANLFFGPAGARAPSAALGGCAP